MRMIFLVLGIAALPSTLFANEIDDAMKKIGPAFMCGAPHEFRDALTNLRQTLLAKGVPEALTEYAVDGLSKTVVREHSAEREKITAKDCSEKYGR